MSPVGEMFGDWNKRTVRIATGMGAYKRYGRIFPPFGFTRSII